MKRIAAILVLVLASLVPAAALRHQTSVKRAEPGEFFCIFSKSVTVAGHTAATPTVCIPSP